MTHAKPLSEAFFAALPKVDIHCHLYGTIREETFQELAVETAAPITHEEVSAFFIRGEKPVGVLHAFRFMEEHIFKKPEYLYRLTSECLEDLASENVRHAELFWNATGTMSHQPGLEFDALQRAITTAMEDAESRYDITARLILAIDREAPPEDAAVLVSHAISSPDKRTIGLGVDYRETGFPPEFFWKAYQMAKNAGLRLCAHAGEFGCHWRNVEAAIDLLQVERLDHGYTMVDNPELMSRIADSGITVTVVPTNSYYLRTLPPAEWASKHPIRAMLASKVNIHPNTDDPTFHNTTPNRVWVSMHQDFGATAEDITRMSLAGIEGSWAPAARKAELRQELLDFLGSSSRSR